MIPQVPYAQFIFCHQSHSILLSEPPYPLCSTDLKSAQLQSTKHLKERSHFSNLLLVTKLLLPHIYQSLLPITSEFCTNTTFWTRHEDTYITYDKLSRIWKSTESLLICLFFSGLCISLLPQLCLYRMVFKFLTILTICI